MLDTNVLEKIEKGEIASRRQLYKFTGRSKKLLQWLNDNKVLVPKKISKELFILKLKEHYEKCGTALSKDSNALICQAQKFYGTWNNALKEVLGIVNQQRYGSAEELKGKVVDFIVKYKRLPLREEFNGSCEELPYWEAITSKLGVKKWSEIFSKIDLSGISYFFDKKHGTGVVRIYNGVVYLSNQEYLIGKFLTEKNIEFEKEVPYDNCNYVFDFYLKDYDVYIEYYGLETVDYKRRIEEKRKKYNGRKVLEIFKHDNTIAKLALEVQRL